MQNDFEVMCQLAGENNVWPVVDCRWGYAAFVAYVIRLKHPTQPNEWWVAEMFDKDRRGHVTALKRICQY